MKTYKGKLMSPAALGRVWEQGGALRDLLSGDHDLVFIDYEGVSGWSLRVHAELSAFVICEGPQATRSFGAELFRKLTGKEAFRE